MKRRNLTKSSKAAATIETPADLRTAIGCLAETAPIADQFERDLVRLEMSDRDRRWYATQKEHWLGWLGEYDGPGYYGRQDSTKRTAQLVYNRIANPAMLLWLVDASGVERDLVESARKAALDSRRAYASQCAAIRRIAPWKLVALALDTVAGRIRKTGG